MPDRLPGMRVVVRPDVGMDHYAYMTGTITKVVKHGVLVKLDRHDDVRGPFLLEDLWHMGVEHD